MNEEPLTTEETSDEYLELLEAVPEEVRRFIWSDAFALIIQTISKAYTLTDQQSVTLKEITLEMLTDTTTPVAIRAKLSEVGILGDFQDTILQTIDEEIISRALAQIKKYNEEESLLGETPSSETNFLVETKKNERENAPSPVEALAMIKDRLSKPNTITPTKRDYSNEIVAEPTISEAPTGIKSVDPYRELPSE